MIVSRKPTCVLVGLVAVALACPGLHAQTSIQLGSSLGTIRFMSINQSPPTYLLVLGSLCSSKCSASGTGGAAGTSGFYDLTGGGTTLVRDVLSGGLPTNTWNVTQTAPMLFCYSSAAACSGTIFLQANLELSTFTQPGVDGTFLGTLSVTGGSLSGSAFGPVASASLVTIEGINFTSTVVNSESNVPVLSGAVDPTPEPATIALVGGGLIAVGAALRRRRRQGLRHASPASASKEGLPLA